MSRADMLSHAVDEIDRRIESLATLESSRRLRWAGFVYPLVAVTVAATDSAAQTNAGLHGAFVAIFLAIAIFRLGWSQVAARFCARSPLAARRILRLTVAMSGFGWGVYTALLLLSEGRGAIVDLVICATVGIAAGSISSLSPCLDVFRIFLVTVFVPLSVPVLIDPAAESVGVAVLLLIFLVFVWTQVTRTHREYRSAQRTAMALEERARDLEEARVAAETASRLKGQFLANMSHEIRTPMNGVLGMTELVLGTNLAPEQREHLEIARSSATSLLRLLDDILDLSRIEAGRISIEPLPFALRSTLAEMMRPLEMPIIEKGLGFAWSADADVPDALIGDPGRLRQILVNLVGNARKFTHEGTIGVRVRLEGTDDDGKVRLAFAVSDTGVGIAPEHLSSIFGAFEQGDGAMTRRYGGTGLGLAISARLAALMGGRIDVESAVNRGSTFTLAVPFARASCEDLSRSPAAAGAEAEAGSGTRALRVLVAEDNAINARLIERMLQREGHSAVVVGDGNATLQALLDGTFDIVLMDVQMPDVDGLEATRRIRKRETHLGLDRLPIVALTAHAMPGDRETCLAAGMDGYVTKPVTLQALRAALAVHARLEPALIH